MPAAVHPLTSEADLTEPREREALRVMRRRVPEADPVRRLDGHVPPSRVPRHIAIIMDGNGRWAKARGRDRSYGHRAGMTSVEHIVREARLLGVEYLTLYSFSSENWSRPEDEVRALMDLYVLYLDSQRPRFVEEGIRVHQIGRRDRLTPEGLDQLQQTLDATRHCEQLNLVLAVDYSSRQEIARAAQRLARAAVDGDIDPADIDENAIASNLDTKDITDPDLLIRAGGEQRLSNYLLWQLSYAEIFVTDTQWPEFRAPHLREAIVEFAARQRRFGQVEPSDGPPTGATT